MNDETTVAAVSPDQLIGISRVKRAAEQGNAEAQYRLALMYGNGDGVPADLEQSLEWLGRAADQGLPDALLTLGTLYANGHGVSPDEAAARSWFIRAAEAGSAKAQFIAATMYRFGQYGCKRDMQRAIDWYVAAANQGLATAQFALGKLLMKGKHIQQDDEVALHWLTLAHMNGSKGAGEYIKLLLERMPPEQLAAMKARMQAGPDAAN